MRFGRRSAHLLLTALLFVVTPLLVTTPALAQNELAVTHYKAGKAYYAQGRYDDAIREFKEAYRLSKKADLLYNIGQTYERVGRLSEAVIAYQRYLDESKAKDPTLHEKIANLRVRIQKTGVSVHANIAGATVFVDGKPMGKTPLAKPLSLKAGAHEVRVTKEGYRAYVIRVAVSVGAIVDVKAELIASASPKSLPTKPAVKPVVKFAVPPTLSPAPHRAGRLWTWVALGVTGVALGVGAGTGAAALAKAGDAKTNSDDTAESAKTLALVSDISFGVGVAATVATVVFYFIEGKGSSEGPAPSTTAFRMTPTVGLGFGGVAAHLQF